MSTCTRVSRWSPSRLSSSSRPGRPELARRRRPSRRAVRRRPPRRLVVGRDDRRLAQRVLDRPHREPLGHDPLRQLLLQRAVGGAEQRAGVAHRQRLVAHQALDRRRELEQAQGVGDRGAAAADPDRDLFVGEAEVLDELLVGRRLLEHVEVRAVDVLDQRVLERRRVVGVADQRGDVLQPDPPRRPPAALAGDQLVAVVGLAHEHRLEDPDLADRLRQRSELLLVEVLPRLVRVRPDRRDRELFEPPDALRVRRRDECPEPLTQPAASRHCSPLSPAPGTPRRPGRSSRTR